MYVQCVQKCKIMLSRFPISYKDDFLFTGAYYAETAPQYIKKVIRANLRPVCSNPFYVHNIAAFVINEGYNI